MSSLGELFFSLGLDSQKFDEAIKKAKDEVAKLTGNVSITASIDADASKVAAQVQEDLKKVTGQKAKINIEVDKSNAEKIKELVASIAEAEANLRELETAKVKDVSAISNRKGAIENFKRQLAELWQIESAVNETKKSINEVAQPSQTVQHVVSEEAIADVKALTDAMKSLNEQMEVSNRLREGQQKANAQSKEEAKQRKISAQWLNETRRKNKEIAQLQKEEEAMRSSVSSKWIDEARQKNAELRKEESAAAKQRVADAKTSNKALQSQLSQLFKLEEAIKKLQNLRIRLNFSGIDQNSENFKKAASALDAYINKLQQLQGSGRALSKREVSSVLGMSMKAVIDESDRYVKEQKAIEKSLIKALSEGSDSSVVVDKKTAAMNKFQKAIVGTTNWASQLNNQLGNAFSIYAIERFIRSLYTVGGEFQKQQIALQNMIGDTAKADVIFDRMKDLAVTSPFTFSELASYTKQMSAYGIEYEELYDTTKRLADISAGVGVDMSRIILAYGQVRSAEVLRGQELRQFTEAGIPLVAELAKRLEEVRGKSVAVGEVFDAISKREISFDMVKDVLFDMTDPGGRFFETQEKLAESLAGKWSNLKDAWDIMIADIANGNNSTLKSLAEVTAWLVKNWEAWLPLITGAAAALGAYRTVMAVVIPLQQAFNILTKANPWIAIASGVIGAAAAIYGYATDSKTAADELKELNHELDKNIQKHKENEQTANRYLDSLKAQNTSEEQRIRLLEELKSLYPDIFKDMKVEQVLLADTIELKKKMAKATKDMTLADYDELLVKAEKNRIELQKKYDDTYIQTGATGKRNKWYDQLEDVKAEIRKNKEERAALEKELDWNKNVSALGDKSTLEEYINLYGEIGKAIKILRDAGINNETVVKPAQGIPIDEYYDKLNSALKEQDDIMRKFGSDTSMYKNAEKVKKVYEQAIKSIGGVIGGNQKPTGGKSEAGKAAERDAKAYYDTLKAELAKISSQWDLYKEIFDVTGNKTLALNLAFDGKIPGFDNYIDHLKGEMAKEIKKRGLGITPDELLSMGKEGIASKVNDKTATVWTEDVAKNLNLLIDRYNQAGNKLRKESIDNFLEIIKASKDFAQQIEDEANNLQRALNTIYSMPIPVEEKRRMEAQAYDNYEEKVAEINFEKFKKTSGWVKIFDDLTKVSTSTLDGLLVDIEEFLPQGVESEEVFKALIKAIRDIKDELLERNPFRAFGSNVNSELGEINDKIKEYNRQIKEAKKNGNIDLVKNLEDKKHEEESRRKEIYDNYSTAFKHGMDKISEFANAVGEVSSMLEKFGNESLKNFGQFLDSITSGMQSGFNVGSLFGGVGGVIGGFVGAATGAMAGLVDAGRKAVAEEQERSQIVIDRLDKVASLLKEKIADSLTGLYNSTLDATSRMEMTLQKEKYDAAEKYYKDKGVDINPNTWYATTFDNTSFSWDTNEYLIYSKKTHEAINKALEADNEYMAMYASLLAQRDEMLYQQATYTDKDSEDVEAFKRDKQIEIEKITMEIEQLSKDMMSSLYSVDFQDWSSQLANSIVNAWATGEDAAKAYEGTVSDIMRNVATSLVRQQVIGEYLNKNLKPFIDEFIAKNGIMDEQMFSTLGDIVDGVGDRTDDALKFMDSLEKVMNEKGLTLKYLSDSSEKGGLSKGIQSVTEDTANLLASYVNSMRADLSVNRTLIEQFVSVDVPQMSIIARAQLQQLQQVAANTRRNADAADRIYELVNKVVDKGGNKLRI